MHDDGTSDRLVLFDLDGVVTTGDTMGVIVRQRLLAQSWRLILAAPAIAALRTTGRWPRCSRHPARLLVRLALLGLDVEQAHRHLAEVGARLGVTADFLHVDAVAAMRRHLDDGDLVVVITASVASMAQALLVAAKAPSVLVVGSDLADAVGGARLRPHAFSEGKLTALTRAGIPVASRRLYTDSLADLPLMLRSREPVLVNPSPRLARAAERALGRRPVCLRWS